MAIFGSCHQTTGPGTEIRDSGKTTTSMLRCSNLSWLSERRMEATMEKELVQLWVNQTCSWLVVSTPLENISQLG